MRYGTAYYGLEAEPVQFETALRALAEGTSLRATARIIEVDKDTVCAWLDRGARQCRAVILSLWRNLPVTECQLDELWSFIHTKQENLAGAKEYLDAYGDVWVWLAFAPVWRLVLGFVIGNHDQTQADRLVEQVAWVTDDTIPFFTSDQWPTYPPAFKPRRRPRADLLYAQVIKHRTGGRITAVSTAVIFGDPAAVAARLTHSPVSQTINTSFVERANLTQRQQNRRLARRTNGFSKDLSWCFVERDNLTQRQQNRRLARRTNGFSKDLSWFEKQLWLSLAYYHSVLPHHSLRHPLPVTEPTRGSGSPRRWCPTTPAMAAGLTDHVWTTEELLSYRVSPLYWEECPILEKLFPGWPEVHHGN